MRRIVLWRAELQLPRMQAEMLNMIFATEIPAPFCPIILITQYRMFDGFEMHTHLMRATGMEIATQKCRVALRGNRKRPVRGASLASALHRMKDRHLRPVAAVPADGGIDHRGFRGGDSGDKGEILLLNGAICELLLQDTVRVRSFCNKQATGRFFIEPVHEDRGFVEGDFLLLEKVCDAMEYGLFPFFHAGSGVHGNSRGFIDHETRGIFVHNGKGEVCRDDCGFLDRALTRHLQGIPDLEGGRRLLHRLAVHGNQSCFNVPLRLCTRRKCM